VHLKTKQKGMAKDYYNVGRTYTSHLLKIRTETRIIPITEFILSVILGTLIANNSMQYADFTVLTYRGVKQKLCEQNGSPNLRHITWQSFP
jgi:hypothetical protein